MMCCQLMFVLGFCLLNIVRVGHTLIKSSFIGDSLYTEYLTTQTTPCLVQEASRDLKP